MCRWRSRPEQPLYAQLLSIHNTTEAEWGVEVFLEAVRRHGALEILNTDQGSQFTSVVLNDDHSKLSMDGKGRAIDNVFNEWLWRSVKYEYIYLKALTDGLELAQGLAAMV